MKLVIIAILLSISICCSYGRNDDTNETTGEPYAPETVMAHIDFKKNHTHVYILGEFHNRSDALCNYLYERARTQQDFYYLVEAYINFTSPYHRGIDEIHLHTLTNFFFFIAYFTARKYWQEYIDEAWLGSKRIYARYPSSAELFQPEDIFHNSLNQAEYPHLDVYDPTTLLSIFKATIMLLAYVQNFESIAFDQATFDLLFSDLNMAMNANLYNKRDIQLFLYLNDLAHLVGLKRDAIFARNIMNIYNEVKDSNLPIIVTIGKFHLPGVTALLKDTGLPHTYIDLETMEVNEVSVGASRADFAYEDL